MICAANLNDLDDPLESDRVPLTGNIQSSNNPIPQSYLNSSIPGEDRRAPINTIDESVWDTVSRDLRASWQKMKLVLWPKYLLGGALQREGGLGSLERGEGGLAEGLRGIAGRLPDADALLQGGVNEGLRDWDLWYAHLGHAGKSHILLTRHIQGPSGVLIITESFTFDCCPHVKRCSFHRNFCACVDWINSCDVANSSSRREDVSSAQIVVQLLCRS